ncbi:MAG: hypothetical protein RLZZ387_3953 [Chloroflexota bacterium]|jgi:hypothetical protein
MSDLSAARLLDVCERGAGAAPHTRALLLLAAAHPSLPHDDLASWSLGRRDAALLDLRARLFGEAVQSVAACPRCATPLELSFRTADVRTPLAPEELPPLVATLDGHAFLVRLRPVSTAALLAAGGQRETLLLHCVAAATRDGEPLAPADIPPEVLDRCAAALAEADPQADIRLALSCEACGERWEAPFDPASFLWREVEIWAERALREVHMLASAYGWTEGEILALSAARRRRYLELVTG